MDESLIMAAQAAGFLMLLWFAGSIFQRMQLSSLVGEILVGIAMGPGGLNVIPQWEGFALLGKLGVFWLMFDGGAHLSLALLRGTGLRAFLVAFTGLVAPLCIVWLVMLLCGFTLLQGFVIGTALAPTSAGMTVKLMSDAGVLQSKIGQMIVCSAMTDDVLSLIILAIVSNLGGAGDLSLSTELALDICLPLLTSAAFILVVGASSLLMPKLFSGCSASVVGPVMVAWSTCLALLCNLGRSSEYMGVFLAGASFAGVHVAVEAPKEEVKENDSDCSSRTTEITETPYLEAVPVFLEREWVVVLENFLVGIFFASAGFFVQVQVLLDPSTLAQGLLCAAVAMVGKLVAGVWCPGHRLSVGMAMASRGELGLVMASQSLMLGLTDKMAFSITVWGVLLNTLIAPPIFQLQLRRMAARPSEPEIKPAVQQEMDGAQSNEV